MNENNYTPENGQPAPQYQPPVYAEPVVSMPQYQPPQYEAPQYQPPQYEAPQYEAPQYQPPQYEAPQYQQSQYQQPQYQYAQPQYQQAQPVGEAPNPVLVLVFGIVSLATAVSFWLSIVGFVFGILGKKKAEEYVRSGAAPATQVTVGGRLAKAGFIVGLIMSILFTIWLIAIAAA